MSNEHRLSELVSDSVDEVGVGRVAQRLSASVRTLPERRRRRARRRVIAASAFIGLLIAGASFAWSATSEELPSSGPLLTADSPPAELRSLRAEGIEVLDLSDGSRVVLAPEAVLEVRENSGQRVELAVPFGSALFDVRPGGTRRWVVDAGPVRVEVLGTRFEVARSATEIVVRVERGRVLVMSEGSPARELGAGERLELALEGRSPEASSEEPAPELTGEEVAESSEAGSTDVDRAGRSARAGVDGWLELAERGDLEGAHRRLGRLRLEQLSRSTRSPEELFLLADVARRAGSPEEALVPLRRIVVDHPQDPRTPLAALTLGRILADRLHRPGEAGDAFTRAVALGLPAGLRPVAQERAFASYRAAGRNADARRAGDAYLRSYPEGSAATEIHAWLSEHAP